MLLTVACSGDSLATSHHVAPQPTLSPDLYYVPTATVEPQHAQAVASDPVVAPTSTPAPAPDIATGASVQAAAVESAATATLDGDEVDRVFAIAGVPVEWRADLKTIAFCESSGGTGRVHPGAVGDHGNSLGMLQLWHGWFREGEDPFNPVTNAWVGARVRATRGRYGGAGGWSCADLHGIP